MNPLLYLIRLLLFIVLIDGTAVCIVITQLPALLLKPLSRYLYRQHIRLTQRFAGSMFLFCVYFFSPAKFVITGETALPVGGTKTVVMANHQIYADWLYLWCWARFKEAHGDIKIILKESLKWVPIFGWGMLFMEFIFLKRKWSWDRYTFTRLLTRAKLDRFPLLLIIYPEGTVITADTKAVSRAYAKKQDIAEDPTHVLLPKTTGLQFCLEVLRPEVTRLLDITVGYEGIRADQCPYDEYPLSRVFFAGEGPKEVHLHLRSFPVDQIPGLAKVGHHSDNPEVEIEKNRAAIFAKWMRARFMEKDEMLKGFYEHGRFDVGGKRDVVEIVPRWDDWIRLLVPWICAISLAVAANVAVRCLREPAGNTL